MKPVRDSMTEALQLWKKIAGKGEDGDADDQKALSHGKYVSYMLLSFMGCPSDVQSFSLIG